MNALWIQLIALVVSAGALLTALSTYRYNAQTRRAEFIYKLHTDFFVSGTYKEVRRILDCTDDAGKEESRLYIAGEPEALTDYLNLFEMVAYLRKTGQLTAADVNALFGYYLSCLKRNSAVTAYLHRGESSFENLSRLLAKLK